MAKKPKKFVFGSEYVCAHCREEFGTKLHNQCHPRPKRVVEIGSRSGCGELLCGDCRIKLARGEEDCKNLPAVRAQLEEAEAHAVA